MARKNKVIIKDGVDVRNVGYYSTPAFVADFISSEMLRINPDGNKVLDPAVGKEELLDNFFIAGKQIESYDIVQYKSNYEKSNFHNEDFIEHFISSYDCGIFSEEEDFDYIIANPPYNCHEIDYIRNNKKRLLSAFPVGVHNMYSIFLSSIIDTAKDGCVIGVITSDSFLTASAHDKLRKKILSTCSIHSLLLCPASLFHNQQADVRTCIMILQKGTQYQGLINTCNRSSSVETFKDILINRSFKRVPVDSVVLKLKNGYSTFVIGVDECFSSLFDRYRLIGSEYPCITCISTGNDKKYLSDIQKNGFTIPFYKNPGKHKFKSNPDAYLIDTFIDESTKVKDFMVRNKQYLSLVGIACSSMGLPFSAVILPQNAVSGVNAAIFPPVSDLYWLLSYLNSSLVTYLIRGILIRSNMVTSGYVASVPILEFTVEEKNLLSNISLDVLNNNADTDQAISSIDEIVFNRGNIPSRLRSDVLNFCKNIYSLV